MNAILTVLEMDLAGAYGQSLLSLIADLEQAGLNPIAIAGAWQKFVGAAAMASPQLLATEYQQILTALNAKVAAILSKASQASAPPPAKMTEAAALTTAHGVIGTGT